MKDRRERTGRRNAIAASLSQACFRKRVDAKKTGRGSYRRQPKHRLAGGDRPILAGTDAPRDGRAPKPLQRRATSS